MRDLIESRCGLRFDDSHRVSLSASVAARMQQLGLVCEDEYFNRLRGEAPRMVEAELRNLLNLVTVTETCFFRDASQFQLLREHILPTLMSERAGRADGSRKIRIWSAGCSTGEEAYSIAITVDQIGMLQGCRDWSVEIVGTDLNTEALEKARLGVYTARAVRNVERRTLDSYFVRDGSAFVLSEGIRNRVAFEFGNITQTPMPSTGPQDVVFCKNVAIYFSAEIARRLIERLYDTLAPGGYLLLGHAESLWHMSDRFTLVEHARAFCYRKRDSTVRLKPTVPLKPDTAYFSAANLTAAAPPMSVTQGFNPANKSAPDEAGPFAEYDVCLAAFRAGAWDIAESALAPVIASCPTFVPALLLLGGLYVQRGRLDDAMRQGEAVLMASDLEPRAHLLLGMIAARRGRHDDAIQLLRRALYLDNSLALGHFWLGNLYRERGDIARACQEYENVVRDWEHHTVQLTEEFASDLTAEQLVGFCSDTLGRLLARRS